MLPVVSRQKTTSTFGFFTSGFLVLGRQRNCQAKSGQGSQTSSAFVVRIMIFVLVSILPRTAK